MTLRYAVESVTRSRVSTGSQVPAPVDGVNANSSLDGMKSTEAVLLENFFPAGNWVESRKGCTEFADTSSANPVETLATFKFGGTSKFLAATNGNIYDITSTPSSLGSGFSEDRWQWTQFNKRTFFVNGTDAPQDFDGTTLSATAWTGTGLTIADLINVSAFKNRLYFVEKDSQNFWYGGLYNVTGTLTKFDLSQVGDFAGNLVCTTALTQDGGDGQDDLFVAILSEGDVVVYNGTDPGSNFFQIGTFKIGRPIGQRPVHRLGSDVGVITEDGYILLTEVLPFGRLRSDKAFSDSYREVVTNAIENFKTNDGWEMINYPAGNKIIVNVPESQTRYTQHVVNTSTLAWCSYKNINAITWGIYEGDIYFGTADGRILQAETGTSDEGSDIVAIGQSAWNYFGNKTQIKKFNDARPLFELETDASVDMSLLVDFDTSKAFSPLLLDVTEEGGAVWDASASVWDVAIWGGTRTTAQDFNTISGVGYAASLAFRVSSSTQQFRWISTTFTMERGGLI